MVICPYSVVMRQRHDLRSATQSYLAWAIRRPLPIPPPPASRSPRLPAAHTLPVGVSTVDVSRSPSPHCVFAPPLPSPPPPLPFPPTPAVTMHFVVCGLHMRGGPLTHQLDAAGGVFVRDALSVPHYTLHVLSPVAPAVGPAKPGMLYHPPTAAAAADTASPAGLPAPFPAVAAIAVEVWDIPDAAIGGLLAGVPPPLAFGSVRLAAASPQTGVEVLTGFVCEGWVARDGVAEGVAFSDITHHGGWRAYMASLEKGGGK